MSNEDIKAQCEGAYKAIRDAELLLKNLRSECKHEKTFIGTWSWRPAAYNKAEICEYCGSCIKILDFPNISQQGEQC